MNTIIRHAGDFRWEGLPVLNYKEDGSHFKAISRQILFEGGPKLGAQLRYFEILPGGHSTLERHDHIHSVMVIRGRGHCLAGDAIYEIGLNDLVYIPPMTWHQFRATAGEPLGFLCLVNAERDKPELPDAASIATLKALPKVGEFIRL
ncbi:MAG TPA: cupin domain-containing protein [Candidatus Methylacidiphilales bacterium]|nr:cupin domain-containing protein [Candidatus Methylacidiphilales bacterium]